MSGTDFGLVHCWPAWQRLGFGLLASSIAAYYAVEITLLVFGQPAYVLYDPIGFIVTVGFLLLSGAFGLLFHRPLFVGCIVALACEILLSRQTLFGPGDLVHKVGQVVLYTMPALSGLLLARWRDAVLRTAK